MVHADSALLPSDLKTTADFYAHLLAQLQALVDGQRSWVPNLSNASSLIYHSINAWKKSQGKTINWAGSYLLSPLLPHAGAQKRPTLLLGPFHGLPACQGIPSVPGRGVCADASALLPPRAVRVPSTEAYPGHIACDSASQSEIVLPLVVPRSKLSQFDASAIEWSGRGEGEDVIVGVLDLDCEQLEGFDEEDEKGLTLVTQLLAKACDW